MKKLRASFTSKTAAFLGKIDQLIGREEYRKLRAAIKARNQEKALKIYRAVDKQGRSLRSELHPSMGFEDDLDQNTPLHFAAESGCVAAWICSELFACAL